MEYHMLQEDLLVDMIKYNMKQIILIILIILNVIERKILIASLKKSLIQFGIIQKAVDIGFGRII